jgi:DNA topoisomerase-1
VELAKSAVAQEVGSARRVHLEGLDAPVRIGRYGPFVEVQGDGEPIRASLPEDLAPGDLTDEMVAELIRTRSEGPPVLGTHPATGLPIYVMRGRFGPYVQLGEAEEGSDEKPKRASLPNGVQPEDVTLEMAVGLLALPRALGTHPDTGHPIRAGLGRFGPFVVHVKGGENGKDDYRSLKAPDDVLTVRFDRALELLRQPKLRRGQTAVTPLRELGAYPDDGRPVLVFEGRYGPYVQLGPNTGDRKNKPVRATLPKEMTPEQITLEQAVAMLAEKGVTPVAKKAAKKSAKKTAKKAATKTAKTAARKTAKKTAAKRTGKSGE